MIVNQGRLTWARGLFGAGSWSTTVSGGTPVSWAGTGSTATNNSYTINNIVVTSGALQGYTLAVVTSGTGATVYANIVNNPSAVSTSCTVAIDQWYTPGTDGSIPGTTPGTASNYFLFTGATPSWYMALASGSMNAVVNSTTNLPGEITTSGLMRKPSVVAISAAPTNTATSGSTVVTLTSVFTVGASDTIPSTINGVGIFNTRGVVSGTGYTGLMFATPFSTSVTLNSIGDQLTVTEQITGP
jgi:hypothetical protein